MRGRVSERALRAFPLMQALRVGQLVRASSRGVCMSRKFGWLLLVLTLAGSASASVNPGAISGYVKDVSGVPQMGATVEIITAAAAPVLTAYTDAKGYFTVRGLLPGTYTVRVSAPSFLPTVREKIGIQSGAHLVVNITLNTLFQALKMLPERGHSSQDSDDWRWTLRSMSNRPVLRFDPNSGPAVVQTENPGAGTTHGNLAFLAGADGEAFTGSDMSTAFSLEHSIFGTDRINFAGDVGYGSGTPNAIMRAGFVHDLGTGSRAEMTFTAKRFASMGLGDHGTPIQALSLATSNTNTFGNLELRYGAELQSIQMLSQVGAIRPFGAAALHLGKNTLLEYRLATGVPNMRYAKGFDSAPADLSESGPRFSTLNGSPQLERARHHEVALSQRVGGNNFQVAVFSDKVNNTALNGVARGVDYDPEFLADPISGTFLVNGGSYQTNGLRAVYQRKLAGMTTTLDYGFGGVLTAPEQLLYLPSARAALAVKKQHSGALKVAGVLPRTHTRVLTSYKWLSGSGAVTPVDMFNASAGQTDPFFNVFLRQPIPAWRFIPGGVEVLVDVRNLLAQGYQPVLGPDGQTVYLVQTARSVRGGLAFSF